MTSSSQTGMFESTTTHVIPASWTSKTERWTTEKNTVDEEHTMTEDVSSTAAPWLNESTTFVGCPLYGVSPSGNNSGSGGPEFGGFTLNNGAEIVALRTCESPPPTSPTTVYLVFFSKEQTVSAITKGQLTPTFSPFFHYLYRRAMSFNTFNKKPTYGWGRQNALPLKFDPKPSEATFSAVLLNNDK